MIYTLLLAVVFLLFLLSSKMPDKFFWIVVILISDPGGYLTFYTPDLLPSYLNFRDFLIPMLFFPVLSPKVNTQIFWSDYDAAKFYKYLIFFLIYQVLVFGWLAPQNYNLYDFFYFLFLWKYVLFSVFLFIPAYIFTLRSIDYFLKILVKTSFPILFLFLFTIVSGIELIPLWTDSRFAYGGYQRVSMLEWGYMQILIYLGALIFILKLSIQNKYIIYFSGSVMIFATLLTLTRGTIGFTFFAFFILTYIISKYLGLFSIKTFLTASFFLVVVVIITSFVAVDTFNAVKFTFVETYKSFTGEQDIASVQSRTEFEIPRQIAAFKESPFIGTGYQKKFFEGALQGESLDVSDTPYIGMWAIYGIIGTLLYIFLVYRTAWVYIFFIFRKIKANIKNLKDLTPEILIFLVFSIFFITSIVFPLGVFSELISWRGRSFNIINFGIIYAIGSKVKTRIIELP